MIRNRLRQAPDRVFSTRLPSPTPAKVPSIAEILESDKLVTYFQPILSARQGTIIGVEALARAAMAANHVLDAGWLFRAAEHERLTALLERVCCEKAIASFAQLPHRRADLILFLNLGSWVTVDEDFVVHQLVQIVQRSGLSPQMIAVEILETRIDNVERLRELVKLFRGAGFLIVLDDVGAGHSNLDRIPLLKPDILKVDRSLIAHIDGDFHKQETLKSLVGLSRKIGALVVAEGLERQDEAIVALELGADLLQGYFLGRPSEDGSVHGASLIDMSGGIESLAEKFKTYMIGKIHNRKIQHRRFDTILSEVLCHLSQAASDQFADILVGAIRDYRNVECLYVLDSDGIQVTDTIWNPGVTRTKRGAMFRPAPKGTDHSLKEYYYILLDVELQKYTTDPYVSFASGNVSRTISTYFREARTNSLFILCIDILADPSFD